MSLRVLSPVEMKVYFFLPPIPFLIIHNLPALLKLFYYILNQIFSKITDYLNPMLMQTNVYFFFYNNYQFHDNHRN